MTPQQLAEAPVRLLMARFDIVGLPDRDYAWQPSRDGLFPLPIIGCDPALA
jgi:hypothetical protein